MKYDENAVTIATQETVDLGKRIKKSILIVDDDQVFSSSLSEGLESVEEGLKVYTAENGYQATAILKDIDVDVVITDLKMPVMGGLELTLQLNEFLPSVPVIVVSAFADSNTILELKKKGNYFFDKPLDFDNLLGTIRNLLL
jgi:two-component system NtrC family response regulator